MYGCERKGFTPELVLQAPELSEDLDSFRFCRVEFQEQRAACIYLLSV